MLRLVLLFFCFASIAWAQVELRSERFSIVLDKEQKGAIVSLIDNATGQEFVVHEAPADLFRLGLSTPGDASGKLIWLSNRDAENVQCTGEEAGQGKALHLTFQKLGGRAIVVECTISAPANDAMMLWAIRVTGSEALILEEVEYPIIALRAPLAEKGEDDACVFGLSKGGVFHRPYEWPTGKWIAAQQPSTLAAQFGCYYNARAGVYTATQDAKGYPKSLIFRRTKTAVESAWRHLTFHDFAKPFDLDYAVAQTTFRSSDPAAPTDWRDAADLYKAWALKQPWCARTLAERDDLPAWIKDGPAMARFHRQWLSRPERIEGWLKDYWGRYFPKAPLIVAFWGWEGVSSWVSPNYFPPYPSEEGFRKYVNVVRDAGGHPFFWPSGYQWAVTFGKREDGTFELDDRERFEKIGRPHVTIQHDGSPYAREYPWVKGGKNATLCRGDAWTRQWLDNIAIDLTKRGADLIQIDQVVSAGMPGGGRCYSREHGHPPGPGLWDAEAFHEQLRTMRTACKSINPSIVLGFEEPQELYNQEIGIQDYRDYEVFFNPQAPGIVPASVFGYLYHEFVPCFQSNPRAGDKLMMAHCLVTGQVPHMVPHWPIEPSPLLRNGGFEEWAEAAPEFWDHVKGWKDRKYEGMAFRDETVKHGGQFSLRLENQKDDDIVQVSQNISIGNHDLRVGKTYRLSLWFKTDQLSKPNAIGIAALEPGLKSHGSWAIPVTQSNEWRRGEVDLAIPDVATFLRIMLHLSGPCKVWLDDVVIEEAIEGNRHQVAMRSGLPAAHELALQWVTLFHGEGRPYLLLGRMLHPPPLLTGTFKDGAGREFPVMLHNAYRAPDGSEAVVAVNITDQPQEGALRWGGKDIALKVNPWEVRLIRK